MDVNGAKALKDRLGSKATDTTTPASADVGAAANALPVYQWLGLAPAAPASPHPDEHDEPAPRSSSLFRRLGPSAR